MLLFYDSVISLKKVIIMYDMIFLFLFFFFLLLSRMDMNEEVEVLQLKSQCLFLVVILTAVISTLSYFGHKGAPAPLLHISVD